MNLIPVGRSGLRVSPLVLGCMSFGDPARGDHPWTIPADRALPFFELALEAGITTFDTADVYSDGTSEEITGRAISAIASREDVVIATKVGLPVTGTGYAHGLSRKHVLASVDASLRRLGTDYIDLYQIHRLDPETPDEELMQTLDDIVRSGKVRYIGASSMPAWRFAQLQHTAILNGWERFVSMQDQYNLLQREEEREMHPLVEDLGVGVLPWSPLARGRLSRPWDTASDRDKTDLVTQAFYHQDEHADRAIVEEVAAIAEDIGVSMSSVALTWVRTRSAVTAPIVGVTRTDQLEDAIASLEIELTTEQVEALESRYTPRLPEGYS